MAEAIYCAALPHFYGLPLFTAIRNRNDERNEGLIPRLANYSFVIPVATNEDATYRVRSSERQQLNMMWIARDAQAFSAAHERAMAHWEMSTQIDEVLCEQEALYHSFFVDLNSAIAELVRLFRKYYNERHLAAIEHLLLLGTEAQEYLAAMPNNNDESVLTRLHQMLMHLEARFAQLSGDWVKSQGLLNQLRHQEALDPQLAPYVDRAYGNALAQAGQYVEAIEQLNRAVSTFTEQSKRQSESTTAQTEQALTLIDLGETYLRFAESARGPHQQEFSPSGIWGQIQTTYFFLTSIPLLIYLSLYLGWRVWRPRFWPTLRNLDWLLARLFANGAYYFQTADPILERLGSEAEGIVADERLAQLYLTLGDVAQAADEFKDLLQNNELTLGRYRRAIVQVGLAEAHIRMERPDAALLPLRPALATLIDYADTANEIRARALLGEALLLTGHSDEGLAEFSQAIAAYAERGEWLEATNAAERLDAIVNARTAHTTGSGATEIDSQMATRAHAISNSLPQRLYTVRYHHPILVLFRRLVALMLPLAVVLTLLVTVGLDSDISLAPNIEFKAAPFLNPDTTVLQQSRVFQGVTTASLAIETNPDAFVPLLISIITGYLGLSLLVGVFVIAYTPLRTIQRLDRDKSILIDTEGVTEGEEGSGRAVRWADVKRLIKADVSIWRLPIPSASSFGLETAAERMVIGANTSWYSALRQRVSAAIPANTAVVDLDYNIVRSRLALLYLFNLLLIITVVVAAKLKTTFLWSDLPAVNYSVVDAYPYLYVGLVAIPLWWGVVRPLEVVRYLGNHGRVAWGMVAGALVLVLVQITLLFRPLLTVPDIYPPLVAAVALISAAFTIWNVQVGGRRIISPWVRWGVTAVIVLVCSLMIHVVWRETSAYHWLVKGMALRDRAQNMRQDSARSRELALQALDAFTRAEVQSRQPLWGIVNTESSIHRTFGIPNRNNFIRLLALKNVAALSAQLEQGLKSIQHYNRLLEIIGEDKEADVYAWRAMARQSVNTTSIEKSAESANQNAVGSSSSSASGANTNVKSDVGITDENSYVEIATNQSAYALSLKDYDQAIALNPKKPQFYLWRGVTHHTLNQRADALADYAKVLDEALAAPAKTQERALSGMGWIYYDSAEYEQAIDHFSRAIATAEIDEALAENRPPASKLAEAWLGLGYAHYALLNLDAAETAWAQAMQLAPTDPIVRISLGTLHWKRGGQANSEEARCADYARAVDYFTAATDRTALRPQDDADVAFTLRTRAQVEWLLRNCPQMGSTAQGLERAIDSYQSAIDLDPQNALYPQMRGRIIYALYSELRQQEEALSLQWLVEGLDNLQQALLLNPTDNRTDDSNDYRPNLFLSQVYQPDVSAEAQQALRNRAPEQAATLYGALVDAALYAQDGLDIVQKTLDELNGFLISNRQINGDSARAVLAGAIDQLRQKSAAIVLEESLATLQSSPAEAVQSFRTGVELAIARHEIAALADSALAVRTMPSTTVTADLLSIVQENLPQLAEIVAKQGRVLPWTKLGATYLALEMPPEAADAYAAAIRLTGADRTQYGDLRNARLDLRALWQYSGVEAEPLLSELRRALIQQVQAEPTLSSNGYYWGVRAWFYYHIGREAFRLEDEAAAQRALELGQPDADRAFANGWSSGDQVHTYLREGAWPWYHVERGNDLFAEERYAEALTDYMQAAESTAPQENPTARREQVMSAFKVMLTLVALGRHAEAAEYVELGLQRAVNISSAPEVQQAAIDLADYLLAHAQVDKVGLFATLLPSRSDRTAEYSTAQNDQGRAGQAALYWRYRGDFGFLLLENLLKERPNSADSYQPIFAMIAADYAAAAQRVQPNSQENVQLLAELLFQAGLTNLLSTEYTAAISWYRNGIALVQKYKEQYALESVVDAAAAKLENWLATHSSAPANLPRVLVELQATTE